MASAPEEAVRGILLVSGSTRGASTNTAALRAVMDALRAEGAAAELYESLAELPAFDPDRDREPLPPAVADLRRQIAEAAGVLLCTPEYAGALPGSFKNLLDWTVGGEEMYGKPVAWLNVAAEGRGETAQQSLATVLGYLKAEVVTEACRRVFVPRQAVSPEGEIEDDGVRERLAEAACAFAVAVGAIESPRWLIPRPCTAAGTSGASPAFVLDLALAASKGFGAASAADSTIRGWAGTR